MKAKPVRLKKIDGHNQFVQCEVNEATHVILSMPVEFEPQRSRRIPVILKGSRDNHSEMVWSWNGDVEKPTLKPSILSQIIWGEAKILHKCHSFVNDGKVQFLSDCSHDKANQTIELLEVEEE